MTKQPEKSSFRDPAGFVFQKDGNIFRQINQAGKTDYKTFMQSGLYEKLIDEKLIVSHEVSQIECPEPNLGWKVIKPEKIDFISYPYEWCFSQLKDAALATLKIQKIALENNMSLKDASAYNIQFKNMAPIMIDSLSFETYTEGQPWVAYRQFCQHFLAPLALMSYTDIKLQQLLKVHIDGLPLNLTNKLLPFSSNFNLGIFMHIKLHAKSQNFYSDKTIETSKNKGHMSKTAIFGIVDSLQSCISGLQYKLENSQWGNYYSDTNYSDKASEHKEKLIKEFIEQIKPEKVSDFGANTGVYSRISTSEKIKTIAFDCDENAVEKNYRLSKENRDIFMLPLLMDLTNPSPAIGWENCERMSFIKRAKTEVIMALALVHHLAIANNLPLPRIADFFEQLCEKLIIEFVPRSDSQVKKLLATRKDIFQNYTKENFEEALTTHFKIIRAEAIKESDRILYLLERKR
jgi:ribosomal protein L11 methylase PrmA